jgi:hypothetical protein
MESMLYRAHRFLGGIKNFRWPRDRGRQTSFWNALHIKNGRRYDQSEGSREVWSTFDSYIDWQWFEFETPNRSRHFDRGIGHADTWMLHHDYAPCHTDISVNEVLTRKCIPVVPKPPYSSEQSPCFFFLFPKLKFHLKGRYFGTADNIQKVMTDQHCYRVWEQLLRRCVASQGNYFEGNDGDF